MRKEFKNFKEQIEYLKDNKKIIVDKEDEHYFKDYCYATLINPYKEIFADGKTNSVHIYKQENSFKDIIWLNNLNKDFSQYLYRKIGIFESKLKVQLITEVCNIFVNEEPNDIFCIKYIEEIKTFLSDKKVSDFMNNDIELNEGFVNDVKDIVPRFCSNLFYSMDKNGTYVLDKFNFKRKISLLEKIYENGIGETFNGEKVQGLNSLIKHYHKTQKICPLWIIANCLTFGDLISLFLILKRKSQENVINSMRAKKVKNSKDIVSFLGTLEDIRKLRNTINHYEPLIPLLKNGINKVRNIKSNKLIIIILELSNLERCANNFISIEDILKNVDIFIKHSQSSAVKIYIEIIKIMLNILKFS